MATNEIALVPDAERLAAQVEADPASLDAVLAAAGPERIAEEVRESALGALKLLAARRPELMLARWGTLMAYLASDNAFTQMATVHTVAILAPAAGDEQESEAVALIRTLLAGKVSVAAHSLMALGEIGAARPALAAQIAAAILDLDGVAIENRLGNLRGYAIEALDATLSEAARTPEVVAFVTRGLDAGSPRTRKVARDTLTKWGSAPAKR